MNKLYLTYSDVEKSVQDILRQLSQDEWKPDYIVGLTRGGLLPAILISQYLNTKMYSLDVALRDHADCDMGPETNCWMSEDALDGKNILIVDDINDEGNTLDWIKNDWQTSNQPASKKWPNVFEQNVRVAVVVNNEASDFNQISYASISVNKDDEDVWIVFPWEEWWGIKPNV